MVGPVWLAGLALLAAGPAVPPRDLKCAGGSSGGDDECLSLVALYQRHDTRALLVRAAERGRKREDRAWSAYLAWLLGDEEAEAALVEAFPATPDVGMGFGIEVEEQTKGPFDVLWAAAASGRPGALRRVLVEAVVGAHHGEACQALVAEILPARPIETLREVVETGAQALLADCGRIAYLGSEDSPLRPRAILSTRLSRIRGGDARQTSALRGVLATLRRRETRTDAAGDWIVESDWLVGLSKRRRLGELMAIARDPWLRRDLRVWAALLAEQGGHSQAAAFVAAFPGHPEQADALISCCLLGTGEKLPGDKAHARLAALAAAGDDAAIRALIVQTRAADASYVSLTCDLLLRVVLAARPAMTLERMALEGDSNAFIYCTTEAGHPVGEAEHPFGAHAIADDLARLTGLSPTAAKLRDAFVVRLRKMRDFVPGGRYGGEP